LIKHLIRQEFEIEHVKDNAVQDKPRRGEDFCLGATLPQKDECRKKDDQPTNRTKVEDVRVEKVRKLNRLPTLAPREWRNEIYFQDLDRDQQDKANNEL
jgi:hypothetical protein